MSGFAFMAAVVLAGPVERDVQHVELANGYYLLHRPADQPTDTPLPLIVCLHGTETSSADILRFWRSLSAGVPYVYVSPQGSRAGWRAPDLPLLRETLEHLRRNVAFDPARVLLTGHSAGGAMAFRLLYAEDFPATALAVTANYLPPEVTAEQAARRARVPVFYAVGAGDPNRTRMRAGVSLLRQAGVTITMRRPRIGHVLDRGVGQEALNWFEQMCRDAVRDLIEQTRNPQNLTGPIGHLAAELESLLVSPEAHFPDQIPLVREAVARLEAPGRRTLARARQFVADRQYAQACGLYARVEREYEPASLAKVARTCREKLERDPQAPARGLPETTNPDDE